LQEAGLFGGCDQLGEAEFLGSFVEQFFEDKFAGGVEFLEEDFGCDLVEVPGDE
jgi:hypothetical protein